MERDPLKMSDMELIGWLRSDQTNNVPLGEFSRRNTIAINKLDQSTQRLSVVMIWLTGVLVFLTFILVVLTYKLALQK